MALPRCPYIHCARGCRHCARSCRTHNGGGCVRGGWGLPWRAAAAASRLAVPPLAPRGGDCTQQGRVPTAQLRSCWQQRARAGWHAVRSAARCTDRQVLSRAIRLLLKVNVTIAELALKRREHARDERTRSQAPFSSGAPGDARRDTCS